MNIPRVAVLCMLATLAILQPARATLISGTITGTVTSTGGAVPGIVVGSLVSGSYTYDDSNTSISPHLNPLTAFSLVLGTNSHVFTLTDLSNFGLGVSSLLTTATVDNLQFLFDPSTQIYLGGGDTKEQTVYGPGVYDATQYFDDVNDDPTLSFGFDFLATPQTALAAVPEPDIVVLLLIGAVGMGASGRNRSKPVARRCVFAIGPHEPRASLNR